MWAWFPLYEGSNSGALAPSTGTSWAYVNTYDYYSIGYDADSQTDANSDLPLGSSSTALDYYSAWSWDYTQETPFYIATAPAVSTPIFSATSTGGGAAVTSPIQFNHTTSSNTNRILLIEVNFSGTGTSAFPVTAVTYGGVAATLLQETFVNINATNGKMAIYTLLAPLTGVNQISLAFTGVLGATDVCSVNVLDYYNVDQTTPISGLTSTGGLSANPSQSVNTDTASVVASFACSGSSFSNTTYRYLSNVNSASAGGNSICVETAGIAGAVNTSYTVGSDTWCIIGFSLKGVAAGGQTVDFTSALFPFLGRPETITRTVGMTTPPQLKFLGQDATVRRSVLTTAAQFKFTGLAQQVSRAIPLAVAQLKFTGLSMTVLRVVQTLVAQLKFLAQAIQMRIAIPLSAPTFKFVGQSATIRRAVLTTAAQLKFLGQALQNKLTVGLTAPTLKFLGKAMSAVASVSFSTPPLLKFMGKDIAFGSTAQIIDFTVAQLKLLGQTIQMRIAIPLAAAQLKFTGQAARTVRLVTPSAAQLKFLAQSVQNKYTQAHTAALNKLTGVSLSTRLAVNTSVAQLKHLAQAMQAKLTVVLTTPTFRFIAQAITVTSTGFIVVATRARISLTRFRQLLKSRKY